MKRVLAAVIAVVLALVMIVSIAISALAKEPEGYTPPSVKPTEAAFWAAELRDTPASIFEVDSLDASFEDLSGRVQYHLGGKPDVKAKWLSATQFGEKNMKAVADAFNSKYGDRVVRIARVDTNAKRTGYVALALVSYSGGYSPVLMKTTAKGGFRSAYVAYDAMVFNHALYATALKAGENLYQTGAIPGGEAAPALPTEHPYWPVMVITRVDSRNNGIMQYVSSPGSGFVKSTRVNYLQVTAARQYSEADEKWIKKVRPVADKTFVSHDILEGASWDYVGYDDEYIFVMGKYTSCLAYTFAFYRMPLNGKTLERIADGEMATNDVSVEHVIGVRDGRIYYMRPVEGAGNEIVRMDGKTGEKTVLAKFAGDYACFNGNWLYYTCGSVSDQTRPSYVMRTNLKSSDADAVLTTSDPGGSVYLECGMADEFRPWFPTAAKYERIARVAGN